jgi:heptosyltransferase-1
VDTGLAHLAVALARPTVGLYITTRPLLTGLHGGADAHNLGGGSAAEPVVPPVEMVWDRLQPYLGRHGG